MGTITAHLMHWPVFYVSFNGKQNDADIQHLIDTQNRATAREELYMVLADVQEFGANMIHVKRLAERAIKNQDQNNQFCLGAALVVRSPTPRFMLSAFLLITPVQFPIEVFTTVEEGITWLRDLATKADTPLPDDFSPESLEPLAPES